MPVPARDEGSESVDWWSHPARRARTTERTGDRFELSHTRRALNIMANDERLAKAHPERADRFDFFQMVVEVK
jgi:hypothetical protein